MSKEAFKHRNFQKGRLDLIHKCNEIIAGYQEDGYDLTLRQLYYQLVSRDIIKNDQKEYNRLGEIINDARLCGLIDWSAIVDRTRGLKGVYTYDEPQQIVNDMATDYRIDKWEGQKYRPEVWIEKDALAGVFSRVCAKEQVDFFSSRGNCSQSEMYRAAKRHKRYLDSGQIPIIFHFGDHDPTGIDITRDIRDRLEMFNYGNPINVDRLALNMEQVKKYDPPPNPAKEADSRYKGYVRNYGIYSWELDALEPNILSGLVEEAVKQFRDASLWEEKVTRENKEREQLKAISKDYDEIKRYLSITRGITPF